LSYVLSFTYVVIYWNNHHHLLHTVKEVSGSILWANLNFLFWLSLFSFATSWMGENHFETLPSALYGFILLAAAVYYGNGWRRLIRCLRVLSARIGKPNYRLFCILRAIGLAFVLHWVSQMIYLTMALIWLVPDRQIEKMVKDDDR
jgi:uncharacterized membrane protein